MADESTMRDIHELELSQVRQSSALARIEEKIEEQKEAINKIAQVLDRFENLVSSIVRIEVGLQESKRHRDEIESRLETTENRVFGVIDTLKRIESSTEMIQKDVTFDTRKIKEMEDQYKKMAESVQRLLIINNALIGITSVVAAGFLPVLFERFFK